MHFKTGFAFTVQIFLSQMLLKSIKKRQQQWNTSKPRSFKKIYFQGHINLTAAYFRSWTRDRYIYDPTLPCKRRHLHWKYIIIAYLNHGVKMNCVSSPPSLKSEKGEFINITKMTSSHSNDFLRLWLAFWTELVNINPLLPESSHYCTAVSKQ